jgi:transcriptional regulator with XRE-family HTH domain
MKLKRTTQIQAKIGVVLQKHREARGLSQRGLAALTGHQRTHIGHIERGFRNPSLFLLDSLARSLGTTLSAMIIEAEKIRRWVEPVPVKHRRKRRTPRRAG